MIDTKEKLIAVAIELFAAKGFAGTSIRDIAKAMGMSVSNIYHYCDSKEGLLLAVFDRLSRRLIAELERAAALDLPPVEHFAELVKAHVAISQEVQTEAKIFTLDLDQVPLEAREAMRLAQRRVLDIYVRQLSGLRELGLLRSDQLTVLAFSVIAVVNWALRWYGPDGGLSLEQVGEETVSFVMHGILGPGPYTERQTVAKLH